MRYLCPLMFSTLPLIAVDIPPVSPLGQPWGDTGLILPAFAGDGAEAPPEAAFHVAGRLGWHADGLRVLVQVVDSSPSEVAKPDELFAGDSVSVFVMGPRREDGMAQLVVRPGRDHAEGLRARYFDYRSDARRAAQKLPEPQVVTRTTADGYEIEAVIPWAVIGSDGAAGSQVHAQVMVHDRHADGGRTLTWRDGGTRPTWMDYPALVLAPQAGTARPVAAWGGIADLSELQVAAMAPRDHAGRTLTARDGERVVGTAVFTAGAHQAAASLRLPVPAGPFARALQLSVDGVDAGTLALPDVAAERVAAFLRGVGTINHWNPVPEWLLPRARPAVFTGTDFPVVAYPEPARIQALVGRFAIDVRHVDANGVTVTRAEKPGRYGAIITVVAGEERFTAYQTLWCGSAAGSDEAAAIAAAGQAEDAAGLAAGRTDVNKLDRDWWHRVRSLTHEQIRYEHLVHLPTGYEADPARRWPAIVFLHGSGDGGDLAVLRASGPRQRLADEPDLPFVLISLRSPSGWHPPAVHAVIDQVVRTHRIDPRRLYLTGFSMGGWGTWMAALDRPERFAAIAVVAGAEGEPQHAARLRGLPVWTIDGGRDGLLARSQQAVAALTAAGIPPRSTIEPEADHLAIHRLAYRWPELYAWFLSHSRPETP